jgi:hypothetical protein
MSNLEAVALDADSYITEQKDKTMHRKYDYLSDIPAFDHSTNRERFWVLQQVTANRFPSLEQ